jgi:hypothetical protein
MGSSKSHDTSGGGDPDRERIPTERNHYRAVDSLSADALIPNPGAVGALEVTYLERICSPIDLGVLPRDSEIVDHYGVRRAAADREG